VRSRVPNGYQNDGEKIQRIEGFFIEGRNKRGRQYQGGTPNKTCNVMDVQNKERWMRMVDRKFIDPMEMKPSVVRGF